MSQFLTAFGASEAFITVAKVAAWGLIFIAMELMLESCEEEQ